MKARKEKVFLCPPSLSKTFSHFSSSWIIIKSAQKCFYMLKLRAPEIPKHSFHGSYNLHPVDLGNRGRTDQAFLPPLQGCRAVFGQKHLSAFRSILQWTQATWLPSQAMLEFVSGPSILTCSLLSFLSSPFYRPWIVSVIVMPSLP